MTAKKKRRSPSPSKARPVPEAKERGSDFKQRREEFLQTFFKKGAEFTGDLLLENERLRYRLAGVESEIENLKRHLGKESAVQELMKRLAHAEKEKQDLLQRFERAEAVSRQYHERHAEVERELNELASLYVASFQLHSTLDLRSVLRNIHELLQQLVGAAVFAVFLADDKRRELGVILHEGMDGAKLPSVAAGVGPIGRAFTSGEMYVAESVVEPAGHEAPLACIPMRVEERVVGVIAVFRLLPQKTRFESVDFELFKLLGAHAATALVGARLYSRLSEKSLALHEYLELL